MQAASTTPEPHRNHRETPENHQWRPGRGTTRPGFRPESVPYRPL